MNKKNISLKKEYIPTLWQRILRVILGAFLVSLLGDIFILISSGLFFEKLFAKTLFPLFVLSFIFALIFAGIPTLIMRLIVEFSSQKLSTRLICASAYAPVLGSFLEIAFKDLFSKGLFFIGSIVVVIATEYILHKHIKYCATK